MNSVDKTILAAFILFIIVVSCIVNKASHYPTQFKTPTVGDVK